MTKELTLVSFEGMTRLRLLCRKGWPLFAHRSLGSFILSTVVARLLHGQLVETEFDRERTNMASWRELLLLVRWPWLPFGLYPDGTYLGLLHWPIGFTHPWSVKKANWLGTGERWPFALLFSWPSLGASSIHIRDAMPPWKTYTARAASQGDRTEREEKARDQHTQHIELLSSSWSSVS